MKREELLDESVLLAQDALVHAMAAGMSPPPEPPHAGGSLTPPPAGVGGVSGAQLRACVSSASRPQALRTTWTGDASGSELDLSPGAQDQSDGNMKSGLRPNDGRSRRYVAASEGWAAGFSQEGSGGGRDGVGASRSREARKMQRLLSRIEQVKTRKNAGSACPILPWHDWVGSVCAPTQVLLLRS
jgi:hypothetical protein